MSHAKPAYEPTGDPIATPPPASCRQSIPDTETGAPVTIGDAEDGVCPEPSASQKAQAAKSALDKLQAFAKAWCTGGDCTNVGGACTGIVGPIEVATYTVTQAKDGDACTVSATLTATVTCVCQ